MKFDLANKIHPLTAIAPAAARTDNTAIVSTIFDMQGMMAAALVLAIGTNTDVNATFSVLLEESDASDMTGATAVADADLTGTEALAGYTFADDAETRKLGYVGSSRYIRATITPAGNDSGNIFLAGVWIGSPEDQPAPNPPV
jgi:hypothetical protein